jgi:hypothetical protein
MQLTTPIEPAIAVSTAINTLSNLPQSILFAILVFRVNNFVVELRLRSLQEFKQALDSFGELKFSSSQPTLSYRVGTGTNFEKLRNGYSRWKKWKYPIKMSEPCISENPFAQFFYWVLPSQKVSFPTFPKVTFCSQRVAFAYIFPCNKVFALLGCPAVLGKYNCLISILLTRTP